MGLPSSSYRSERADMSTTTETGKSKVSSENTQSEEEERSSITSKGSSGKSSTGGFVKWLYPGAPSSPDRMSSSAATDKSIQGSTPKNVSDEDDNRKEGEGEMQAQTSTSSGVTTGGPDSDVASVEDLPVDDKAKGVSEDLTEKMTASANYLGSMFSTAWTKTAKTANDATATSTNLLSRTFSKVAGGEINSEEKKEGAENEDDKNAKASEEANSRIGAARTASNLFNSAIGSFGFGASSAAKTEEGEKTADSGDGDKKDEDKEKDAAANKESPDQNGNPFGSVNMTNISSAFSSLSKVAVDATMSIKDKVGTTNMLAEFNKEQDSFIKSKGNLDSDSGVAPWVGYQDEEELKAKILSLSEDRRNFVRAPPSGVTFEFEYSSVSPTALSLLQEDPRLQEMRYELVPKKVKEEEFWRNYFYRVSLIKQSFELKDLERGEIENNSSKEEKKQKEKEKQAKVDKKKKGKSISDDVIDDDMSGSADQDEDFVSESYQASTSDIAEVDESMKKLGVVGDNAEEWEAELEGELNEFEVVKDGSGAVEDNQEWESQIQEMLDAEEGAK